MVAAVQMSGVKKSKSPSGWKKVRQTRIFIVTSRLQSLTLRAFPESALRPLFCQTMCVGKYRASPLICGRRHVEFAWKR
jgi:hypothetical protein